MLEVKGRETQEDEVKREFLVQWVNAVNAHGGFGQWCCEVSRDPKDLADILAQKGK